MSNSTASPSIANIDYSKAPVKIAEREKALVGKVKGEGSLTSKAVVLFNNALEGQEDSATALLDYIAEETAGVDGDVAGAVYIGLAATGNPRAMANLGRRRSLESKIDEAREMLKYVIDDFESEKGNTINSVAGFAHFAMGELELAVSNGGAALPHFKEARSLSDNPNVLEAISKYEDGIKQQAQRITITKIKAHSR